MGLPGVIPKNCFIRQFECFAHIRHGPRVATTLVLFWHIMATFANTLRNVNASD